MMFLFFYNCNKTTIENTEANPVPIDVINPITDPVEVKINSSLLEGRMGRINNHSTTLILAEELAVDTTENVLAQGGSTLPIEFTFPATARILSIASEEL